MSIAERIYDARMAKNFTRNQVATRAGLTAMSIYHYETGRRVPNTEVIGNLAKALDVDVNYLLGFEKLNQVSIPFYEIDKVDFNSTEGVKNTIVKVFDADFATTVPDNAMFPDFKKGDIIFLKKATHREGNGHIVLVEMDNTKMLRRLSKENQEESSLSATNPELHPVKVYLLDWGKKVNMIGVVVGKASAVD